MRSLHDLSVPDDDDGGDDDDDDYDDDDDDDDDDNDESLHLMMISGVNQCLESSSKAYFKIRPVDISCFVISTL